MKRLLSSLVISIALAGCGSPIRPAAPEPPPAAATGTFALLGTLTESAPTQNVAIANATITVVNGVRAGEVFTTDAGGQFAITGLSGAFDFTAHASGYEDATAHVESAVADLTRVFELKPLLSTVTETIGTELGPRRQPASFFRNVHHDGNIIVSQLYFYFTFGGPSPVRTIEVWNGTQLLGAGSINEQQWHDTDLSLRVPGGVRYEIRIVGGDWSKVKIISPS